MDTTVLITGSRGYLGSCLCTLLRDFGYDVVGIDNDRTSRVDAIDDTTQYHLDVADYTAMPTFAREADVVVHLAAMPGINECAQHPIEASMANVVGTVHVARSCAETGVPLVFASSCGVYGGPRVALEEPRLAPNLYMQTKRAGEDVIRAMAADHMKAITFQMSNLYGSHSVDGTRVSKRTVINAFIERALDGKKLLVHEPGTQTRDFLHVRDAAQAFYWAVRHLERGLPTRDRSKTGMATAPLGGGEILSVLAVAELVQQHSPEEVEIELIENPRKYASGGEVRAITEIDDGPASSLGFTPEQTVEQTVKEAFARATA